MFKAQMDPVTSHDLWYHLYYMLFVKQYTTNSARSLLDYECVHASAER